MQQDEGQAILGTPNGLGCGYVLAQHKEKLGVNTITEVTVWAVTAAPLEDDEKDSRRRKMTHSDPMDEDSEDDDSEMDEDSEDSDDDNELNENLRQAGLSIYFTVKPVSANGGIGAREL